MKSLDNVCLVTIDGRPKASNIVNFNKINNIIDFFNEKIKFKFCINFTNSIEKEIEHFDKKNTTINAIKIPPLNYYGYNIFCVNNLYYYLKHINCDYFLIIQDDGFIINPELWDDNFLNYDYIGAPWINNPNEEPFGWVKQYGYAVGNGGFSLRSKKFLEESSKLHYNSTANEDVYLTCIMRDFLSTKGIKFPDISLAAKFSIETKTHEYNTLKNCFGFHGKHNLEEVKKILLEKGITNVL
jgi:hypothetical protein